tara:strand:- start:592 stop:1146 length:555 start_codon:yes stop_codon:yes gene_type:complete
MPKLTTECGTTVEIYQLVYQKSSLAMLATCEALKESLFPLEDVSTNARKLYAAQEEAKSEGKKIDVVLDDPDPSIRVFVDDDNLNEPLRNYIQNAELFKKHILIVEGKYIERIKDNLALLPSRAQVRKPKDERLLMTVVILRTFVQEDDFKILRFNQSNRSSFSSRTKNRSSRKKRHMNPKRRN